VRLVLWRIDGGKVARVAVCCSVLQCVQVCCRSVLQCVAVCSSVLPLDTEFCIEFMEFDRGKVARETHKYQVYI